MPAGSRVARCTNDFRAVIVPTDFDEEVPDFWKESQEAVAEAEILRSTSCATSNQEPRMFSVCSEDANSSKKYKICDLVCEMERRDW